MRLKRNSSSSFHSLLYQNSRWHRDAHRDARMRAWFTHPFANVKKNLAATLVGSMTQSSTSSCGRPNRWTMPGVAIVTNNASILEQGCAGHSPNSANRKYQITRHPWRTSPPLRPCLSFRYTRYHRGGPPKPDLRPSALLPHFGLRRLMYLLPPTRMLN